jgi:hypothetical protein
VNDLATRVEAGSTIVVRRDVHTYSSHPCVTKLANGEWLVAFCESVQREPLFLHPPSDPRFLNLVSRSYDQGETWEEPRVAPSYDWYGVETPGIAQISNGDVLLSQWRFRWHAVEEARKLWSKDGIELHVCDPVADPHAHHWRPARSDEDWERHPLPYARADLGAFVHISTDDGYTWDRTVSVDTGPYRGAFSPRGAIELGSGDLLLALGSQDHDPLKAAFVVRSRDRGRTWETPIEVARVRGLVFSEPSAVETESGKLLVFCREEITGHVHLSESLGGGRTWSEPRQLPFWGYPAHAIRLSDGRLLVVYGRRRAPFGIRAVLSDDEGDTWGPELVVRDDLPNENLGYPSVIEYAPAKLFTVYYGEDGDGVTCIQGTYFDV